MAHEALAGSRDSINDYHSEEFARINARFLEVDQRIDGLEHSQGTILREVASAHEESVRARVAAERAAEVVNNFSAEYSRNELASYQNCRNTHNRLNLRVVALEASVKSKADVPAITAENLGWDFQENTNHGREGDPALSASVWATRAKEAAKQLADLSDERERLALENAALRAEQQTKEHLAQAAKADARMESERAKAAAKVKFELSIARWKLVAGLVAAVLGSGTVAVLLQNCLSGTFLP